VRQAGMLTLSGVMRPQTAKCVMRVGMAPVAARRVSAPATVWLVGTRMQRQELGLLRPTALPAVWVRIWTLMVARALLVASLAVLGRTLMLSGATALLTASHVMRVGMAAAAARRVSALETVLLVATLLQRLQLGRQRPTASPAMLVGSGEEVA
jgi:hypothetical protein